MRRTITMCKSGGEPLSFIRRTQIFYDGSVSESEEIMNRNKISLARSLDRACAVFCVRDICVTERINHESSVECLLLPSSVAACIRVGRLIV